MKNPEKFWTKLCQKECARYGYNHHQGYITAQLEQRNSWPRTLESRPLSTKLLRRSLSKSAKHAPRLTPSPLNSKLNDSKFAALYLHSEWSVPSCSDRFASKKSAATP